MNKKCEYCGKSFYVKPFWIKTKVRGRFCSMKCRRTFEKKYKNETVFCLTCNKEMTYPISLKKKYCSRKCFAVGHGKLMSGKTSPNWSSIEVECDLCGKKFYRQKHWHAKCKKFYCSRKCSDSIVEVRYGGRKQYIRFHHQRRKALMRKAGNLLIDTIQRVYEDNIKKYGTLTCYLCEKPILFGKDNLEHKIPLCRNGTNKYENLAVSCQSCNNKKYTKTENEFREVLCTSKK